MSKAPDKCRYCDGTGRRRIMSLDMDHNDITECGFCKNGKPLDTQEDWDNSWGRFEDAHDKGEVHPIVKDVLKEHYGIE